MQELEGQSSRKAAQEAILDLFTEATGLPITLIERAPDDQEGFSVITSDLSRANFAPFCDHMMSDPETWRLCDDNMKQRAERVFETGISELACCHAGLHNQLVPVVVDGVVRAVLSYGEVQLNSNAHRKESHEQFQQFCHTVQREHPGVNLVMLRDLRLRPTHRIPAALSVEEFERYKGVLDRILRLLYVMLDGEEQTIRNNERVKHELQMRLQALLPAIENLDEAVAKESGDALQERVDSIFLVAKSMRTVVNTLTKGKFMTSYHFRRQPMWGIIQQAIAVYKAEADARGIAFQVQLRHSTNHVELSLDHMQMAVDNLVYNAIKYSYTTGENTPRYVRVYDHSTPSEYSLIIENYGIGILPDEISSGYIFQDGYQGKLRTNEHRTGSGMGLSMAKYVVDRHHGRLEIRSEPQAHMEPHHRSGSIPYLTRVALVLPYHQP